jgi:hypothetical protein
MKKVLFTAICVIPCLSTLAQAQCPAALTNPLQLIDGQTWVFQTASGGNTVGQASIGKFTAKFNPPTASDPFATGTLSVTQTLSIPTGVLAEMTAAGTYQINPDCSGGNFSFAVSTEALVFTFTFADNFTEMYLVSTQSSIFYQSNWGTANVVPTPISCPAGITSPLDVINNTTFGFGLFPVSYFNNNPPAGTGIFGLIEGLSRGTSPVTIGEVSGNVTLTPFGGTPTIKDPIGGRYTVDSDCSGGTIFFGTPYLPQTFQYVFVNPAFTEMYMLSLDPTNPLGGHAKKF